MDICVQMHMCASLSDMISSSSVATTAAGGGTVPDIMLAYR